MYRRPKFLEILLEIRREMANEADYDVDLYAEMVRSGNRPSKIKRHSLGPTEPELNGKAPAKHELSRERSKKARVRR
jgi:hypothetical protein